MVIAGTNYQVQQWPSSTIRRNIDWIQDAAGYWNGYDWGAAQDAYETVALFAGPEVSIINSVEVSLHVSRELLTLSNFGFPLFAPIVDHTGSLSAVMGTPKRSQLQWGYPYTTHQIYQLEVPFRAVAPPLLAVTPSLDALRPVDGFEAGSSFESLKAFTYNQTPVYEDHRSDVGHYPGKFSQSTAELQAILAYILVTARANVVAFPASVSSKIAYPFGRTRGTPGNCVIKGFEYSRKNLNRWNLKIDFHEAP